MQDGFLEIKKSCIKHALSHLFGQGDVDFGRGLLPSFAMQNPPPSRREARNEMHLRRLKHSQANMVYVAVVSWGFAHCSLWKKIFFLFFCSSLLTNASGGCIIGS